MSTDPLQVLLTEIQNVEKGRIKPALTWEALGQKIQDAVNGGKPLEEDFVPGPPPIPATPAEFPKLLVDYGKTGLAQEWVIANNFQEWAPYHHWWVRPMAELSALKEQGLKERPKEDWQRRKEASKK